MANQNTHSRNNNFPAVRLLGAVFVFGGHMGEIMGTDPPLFGRIPLQEIGVALLFLVSGYLVTKSWLSDPNLLRFGIRRFLRLWPPFAVVVLLMAFVAGPLLSELGIVGYFQHGGVVWYLRNLRFLIVYNLPGVFTHIPIPNSMNGSFWTMPVEAALYVVTPVLLTLLRVKGKGERTFPAAVALAAAAVGFDFYLRLFHTGDRVLFYGTDWISAYHLVVFYLMGLLYTYEKMRRLLNLQAGCALMCIIPFSLVTPAPFQYLVMQLVLPYAVLSFVFTAKPIFHALDRKMELSYGIYLYGFFFQQLVAYFRGLYSLPLTYMQGLLISAVPTLLAAVLSFYLVEKPMMRLSRAVIRRLTPQVKEGHALRGGSR